MWNYLGKEQSRYGGDDVTYLKAAEFLNPNQVEDWGCGFAYAKRFFLNYRGIDQAPGFADVVADLRSYTSRTEGILLRHVLEHNWEWEIILHNALASAKKIALIIFTPFQEKTQELAFHVGVGVPDIGFKKSDLTDLLSKWTEETLLTKTQYGVETIFYIHANPDRNSRLS